MKVLVTGAGGFIGGHLCVRLAVEGNTVIAATREEQIFAEPLENLVVGDLTEWKDWSVLDGCDAVVHLAAYVHSSNWNALDRRLSRQVNVDLTGTLVRESKARGVGRFVFMSTVKVHGELSGRRPLVESSPIAPQDPYATSKAEAEVVVRNAGIPHVILRPPLVYGPRVGGNFRQLFSAVAKRRPLPFARIANRRSLVFVGNLVDAIARSLIDDAAVSQTFFLRDGEDVATGELVRRIAQALEIDVMLLPVPVWLLTTGATLLGQRGATRRLTGSLEIDDSQIREVLDWSPPFTLDQGLKRTADWFRENGR